MPFRFSVYLLLHLPIYCLTVFKCEKAQVTTTFIYARSADETTLSRQTTKTRQTAFLPQILCITYLIYAICQNSRVGKLCLWKAIREMTIMPKTQSYIYINNAHAFWRSFDVNGLEVHKKKTKQQYKQSINF